jgi:PH (Pleckstrin Homology) domain-containing protein
VPADPSEGIYTAAPRRLRLIIAVFGGAVLLLAAFGWLALPASIRVLFTLSQRLTLLIIVGSIVLVLGVIASSSVRADATGLRLRNGLRTYVIPWSRVHKILLRRGDPWAFVLLRPDDGRPFEADLDADKRMLMGILATEGAAAQHAVDELRQRLRRYRSAQ